MLLIDARFLFSKVPLFVAHRLALERKNAFTMNGQEKKNEVSWRCTVTAYRTDNISYILSMRFLVTKQKGNVQQT